MATVHPQFTRGYTLASRRFPNSPPSPTRGYTLASRRWTSASQQSALSSTTVEDVVDIVMAVVVFIIMAVVAALGLFILTVL